MLIDRIKRVYYYGISKRFIRLAPGYSHCFLAVFELAHQVRHVQGHANYYVPAESDVREQRPGTVPGDVVQQRPFSGRFLKEVKQPGGFCVRPSLIEQTTQA